MKTSKEPKFLTVPEAAEVLRIDPETVYRLCRSGDMPGALKLGRSWRINSGALIASLN